MTAVAPGCAASRGSCSVLKSRTSTSLTGVDKNHEVRSLLKKSTESLAAVMQRLKKAKAEMGTQAVQRRRAFFISAVEESELVEKMYKPNAWQLKLLALLHSSWLQSMLTIFLIIDVLIVVAELFLDAEFPGCSTIKRDCVSCCSNATNAYSASGSSGYGRMLYGDHYGMFGDHGRMLAAKDICDDGYDAQPYYPRGCDPYKHLPVYNATWAMFILSVAILACFELELLLLMLVLRHNFARNKLYIIDFVVVTSALVLEVVIKISKTTTDSDATGDLAGVLTFARCWRFVRLGHGLVSSLHEGHSRHVDELEGSINSLGAHVSALQERLELLETDALKQAGGRALKKFGKAQPAPSRRNGERRGSVQQVLRSAGMKLAAALGAEVVDKEQDERDERSPPQPLSPSQLTPSALSPKRAVPARV